jgi:hypothetical protein
VSFPLAAALLWTPDSLFLWRPPRCRALARLIEARRAERFAGTFLDDKPLTRQAIEALPIAPLRHLDRHQALRHVEHLAVDALRAAQALR